MGPAVRRLTAVDLWAEDFCVPSYISGVHHFLSDFDVWDRVSSRFFRG